MVSHASAFIERNTGTGLQFIGLFEAPRPTERSAAEDASRTDAQSRYSVPPPPVSSGAARTDDSYRTLPPIREIFEPRTQRAAVVPLRIREPARHVFLPVAQAVLDTFGRGSPGYKQGLFVMLIGEPGKRRQLVVQLSVIDAHGMLGVLDPPGALVDAAAQMVDADRNDGNGPWRKLVVRVTPKVDGGATLNVDVV